MANISAYSEKAMLDWMNRNVAPATVASRAIGLSTAAPTSVSGSEMVTGSGYTRQACGTTGFSTASSPAGTAKNATAYTFGPFQTTYSITGIHIWDTAAVAVDTGNMHWYGNLATARTVLSGDSLVIAVDALTLSLA